ncbi:hypothetical protein QYE76_048078 [Lolium multiflorum]|uniref:Integrase catalytic domain-containing protein n=1 Tax=Lolium multiflorum TaxID=4521 RepID=A0AAD8TPY6_LOLMU|nr:hypothetical protein QYE76_048078 [Lolium multiflorum]
MPGSVLKTIPLTFPFAVWVMDMVGKYKTAPGGYTHLLVVVDKFTKWVESKPIKKWDGKTATKFLRELIYRYGYPHSIITDNGTNFAKGEMADFYEEKGISDSTSPQSHTPSRTVKQSGQTRASFTESNRDWRSLWSARPGAGRKSYPLYSGASAQPQTGRPATDPCSWCTAPKQSSTDIDHDSPRVANYAEEENELARQDGIDLLDEERDLADEDIPTSVLPPSLPVEDDPAVKLKSNEKDKDAADLMTWRDFEALRNEMRREFRIEDDELRGEVQEINQKLDATNETVTTMADQMTDIQRSLQALQLAVENLTNQQQQQDEDPDEVPGRGNRPRGWAPLGRHGRGQDEEDGLGKPKFSIPKFEGGADVEEYLTWELKIEKLWSLHPNYTEDRKIKLASSEFDGYALRWWDALVRNRQADGEPPIITWRAMKEAMNSRFVPTNYLRTKFDKLTLLRQGVKTVDEYYMEMEMLMQRGRVNGLKYDIKGIVRHYSYTNMNQLLHHAREAESQLADEAKVKGRAMGAGRFTPRAPPPAAPAPLTRSAPYSTTPSKPVSNLSNAKKSESAANDDDYDTDGEDAYPSDARTIVVSQRALNVLPSASTQCCNLFQTKALVGPDKACMKREQASHEEERSSWT